MNSYSPWFNIELNDLKVFKEYLMNATDNITCTTYDRIFCYSATQTCDNLYQYMKPLSFKLDSTTYTIPPELYALDYNKSGYKCMIYVSTKHDSESIDLGTLFMQGFVTSYDYSSGVVRFGVNVNAPEGTTMVTDSSKPSNGHKTIVGLIIAIILILIIVLIVIVWFLLDKRRSKN